MLVRLATVTLFPTPPAAARPGFTVSVPLVSAFALVSRSVVFVVLPAAEVTAVLPVKSELSALSTTVPPPAAVN